MIIALTFGSNFLSFSIGPFQLTLFRLLLIVAFVMTLLVKHKHPLDKKKYKLNVIPIIFAFSLFSVIFVKDLTNFLKYEFFIVTALMTFYVISSFATNYEKLIKCIKAFNISICIQAFIGLAESILKQYFFVNEDIAFLYTRYGDFPPTAMLYNTNNFALLMLFGVVICFSLLLGSKKGITKTIYLALLVLYSYLIFLTTSRACLLGVVIVFFIFFFFYGKSFFKRLLLIIFGISFVVIFFSYFQKYTDLSYYADESRMTLVKNGLFFVGKTFGLGIGTGQAEYWLTYNFKYPVSVTALHNWFMELLVSFGVVAFVYYICVYFSYIKASFKMMKSGSNKRISALGFGIFSFLLSFVIANTTVSNVMSLEWFWSTWILITVSIYLVKYSKDSRRQYE